MNTGCTVSGELDVIVGVRTRIDEEVEHVANATKVFQCSGELAVRKKCC